MMDDTLLKLTDISFPLTVIEHYKTGLGPLFDAHLHEHYLQIFYFISGEAQMFYNQISSSFEPHGILLVNTNEVHYGENSFGEIRYFVFRIDLDLLFSYHITSCGEKYLEPLKNGLIRFQNKIESDHISKLLDRMINECRYQKEGYELNLLCCIFDLLGQLFQNHKVKSCTQQDAEILMKKTKRFTAIFEYIADNYSNNISLSEISKHAHISEGYFCRTFKQATGKTLVDYINRYRIEKSVVLLNQGICNVTEAAMTVGFDDVNYFSRVFKKYMKQSPENYLKNDRKFFL